VLILVKGWHIADPILAIGISVLIMVSAFSLVREAVDVLLEATPAHVDVEKLRAALLQIPCVTGIHDLHIWTITTGMYALSCHVVVTCEEYSISTLEEIRTLLHEQFDIPHQTIQMETSEMAEEEEIHL